MARTKERVRSGDFLKRVAGAVRGLPPAKYLLAVSGGRDSMVLLDAFARFRTDAVAVATFDHATGAAATEAAMLVELEGESRGIAVVTGRRGEGLEPGEAKWRAARWEFLTAWAREFSATVVTAHTRDDQLETVVMRILRDPRNTSVRGLAAMHARSDIARPLLDVGRADIVAYAESNEVRFVEDPSNASSAHLRNRLRHDLLPALERAQPGFGNEMLTISRKAAAWREAVERIVDSMGVTLVPDLVVPLASLEGMKADALGVLWPAIASRGGITLDWRGTERLVAFTTGSKPGGRIQLSGGGEVERTAATFVIRATAST